MEVKATEIPTKLNKSALPAFYNFVINAHMFTSQDRSVLIRIFEFILFGEDVQQK